MTLNWLDGRMILCFSLSRGFLLKPGSSICYKEAELGVPTPPRTSPVKFLFGEIVSLSQDAPSAHFSNHLGNTVSCNMDDIHSNTSPIEQSAWSILGLCKQDMDTDQYTSRRHGIC